MSTIPEKPPLDKETIAEWYSINQQMKQLKVKEHLLRLRLAAYFFPTPKEGTNKIVIPEGGPWMLKLGHVVNRAVDNAAFISSKAAFEEKKMRPDKLVQYKPELVKSEYNKLTEAEQKDFDQVLTIKPGTPSLEIWISAKDRAAIESLEKTEESE